MFDRCDVFFATALVVIVVFFGVVALVGSSSFEERYNELYQECVSENVLSDFECKQAAHYMVYG